MATKKGSKLNKSETVQVRFDPVLKMATEIAAGRERRSLSSFIEWAVEQAVKQSRVTRNHAGEEVSAWDIARECWANEPFNRLMHLAETYPDAMTIRERKIMQAIQFSEKFFKDTLEMIAIQEEAWDALGQYADDAMTLPELVARFREIRGPA